MPTVEHSALTTGEIHEPKGAAAASAGEMFVADGAGSGEFTYPNPYGGWRYNDIGTGTTFTTPTSYTLMDVVGTTTNLNEFTHNALGRLTYTGTQARHLHAVIDTSFKHSTGGGNDIYFAVYKNGTILGTPNSEMIQSADSATYHHIAIHFDDMASTNDYYEIYLKVASGNVIIHSAYMFLMGMPG